MSHLLDVNFLVACGKPVLIKRWTLPTTGDWKFAIDNIPVHLSMLLVKTTIDFPDEILHRAKIVAAQRKTTLKELVIAGLAHTLDTPSKHEDTIRRERAARLIAALS